MLTAEEYRRYNRHVILDKIGESGQEKLKQAKVLIVGAGGLGCPVLQYLTAAGVGTIGIVDFDTVDESNLQRQILFTIDDIGKSKALCAKERLSRMNPLIKFDVYNEKLTPQNALQIFRDYDIVVDGTDNFSTRYLVNDACVIENKPLVYGAIYKFEGQVTVFNYQEGPTYRCLFPSPPEQGTVPGCSEVGVLGVLPGLIGVQQANEVIKIILGIGKVLSGELQVIDALGATSIKLKYSRSQEEIDSVLNNKATFEQNNYDLLCGIENSTGKAVDVNGLMHMLNDDIQIVDVREPWEQPRIDHLNPLVAPMNTIPDVVDSISRDKKVIVCCQKGFRSQAVIDYLEKEHGFDNLINLEGGLASYK